MAQYDSFQDLPPAVAEKLKDRLWEGDQQHYPSIPEDATLDERMAAHSEAFRNPVYTEEQLEAIADAFTVFNNAVKRGLPNQLYQMMARVLDTEIAQRAHAAHAIWYAHEGGDLAKDHVRAFSKRVQAEINRREDWEEEQFHREYFLKRE